MHVNGTINAYPSVLLEYSGMICSLKCVVSTIGQNQTSQRFICIGRRKGSTLWFCFIHMQAAVLWVKTIDLAPFMPAQTCCNSSLRKKYTCEHSLRQNRPCSGRSYNSCHIYIPPLTSGGVTVHSCGGQIACLGGDEGGSAGNSCVVCSDRANCCRLCKVII